MNYFKLLLVFTFLIPIVAFSQIKEKNIDAVVIKSSKKKLKKKDSYRTSLIILKMIVTPSTPAWKKRR